MDGEEVVRRLDSRGVFTTRSNEVRAAARRTLWRWHLRAIGEADEGGDVRAARKPALADEPAVDACWLEGLRRARAEAEEDEMEDWAERKAREAREAEAAREQVRRRAELLRGLEAAGIAPRPALAAPEGSEAEAAGPEAERAEEGPAHARAQPESAAGRGARPGSGARGAGAASPRKRGGTGARLHTIVVVSDAEKRRDAAVKALRACGHKLARGCGYGGWDEETRRYSGRPLMLLLRPDAGTSGAVSDVLFHAQSSPALAGVRCVVLAPIMTQSSLARRWLRLGAAALLYEHLLLEPLHGEHVRRTLGAAAGRSDGTAVKDALVGAWNDLDYRAAERADMLRRWSQAQRVAHFPEFVSRLARVAELSRASDWEGAAAEAAAVADEFGETVRLPSQPQTL